MTEFKIKLVNYYAGAADPLFIDGFVFSSAFSKDESGALLYLQPDDSLFHFKGPKALYCQESKANLALYRSSYFRKCMKRLEPGQFLSHWNTDPKYQVPHITHWDRPSINKNPDRKEKAVAVISNCGPLIKRILKNNQAINLRMDFAVHPEVDLFGDRKTWGRFRKSIFAFPHCPGNYRGEIPGNWGGGPKLEVISRYKAMVCMENTQEPHYFTEKFVDAARAGCIPIYHAHETVRNRVLRGAKWVDPADFQFNVDGTLKFALGQKIEDYWNANGKWLESEAISDTNFYSVFERIGEILLCQSRRM
jgi:hypothetical protein